MLSTKKMLTGVSVLLGTAALMVGAAFAAQNQTKPVTIKWLIAHEPISAFQRAAKTFAETVAKETKGEVQVQVLFPSDFGSKTGNLPTRKVLDLLAKNKVQMCQTVTTGIGEVEPKFWVFDLPFLFNGHDHATRVLDGQVGQKILASLSSRNLHGLAFTYSGGFRILPGKDRELRTIEDFKGLKVRTSMSPVAQQTYRLLGAQPVPTALHKAKDAFKSGKVDLGEATYVRFNTIAGKSEKVINETYHSLFLTAILSNESFFKSLSKEHRTAIEKAALEAARIERADSLTDGERVKQDAMKSGVKLVKMSDEELRRFEEATRPVYGDYAKQFGGELIEEIRKEASVQ